MDWSERIGRRIKLRDLHILLAVAQSGSIAKAAKDLSVSQPVVSKVIADIERTVGVRLLDRDRYGAAPTIYGAALLRRGVAAFDELRQGLKDIESLTDPTAGEVWVGTSEVMAAGVLPVVIDQINQRYPRLNINSTQLTAFTTFYKDKLRERAVDFYLGRLPTQPIAEDFATEILFDEPVAVAAGIQNRWANRRKITLAELMDERWALPQGPDPRAFVTDTFRDCALKLPSAAVSCNSMYMICALLSTGRYLAMLPRSFLRFGGQRLSIKTLPVKLPPRAAPVGLVTLRNRTLSPAVQLFIDCIRTVVRPLANQ
jgi:DNA-binding transcriptional LysR family regulator